MPNDDSRITDQRHRERYQRLSERDRSHLARAALAMDRAARLLTEIRDRKGWAALGYESFDSYCRHEHGMSEQEAGALASLPMLSILRGGDTE